MSELEVICPIHKSRKYAPECARCHGEGEIEADDDLMSLRPGFERCYSCAGRGVAPWLECEFCEQDAADAEAYKELRR